MIAVKNSLARGSKVDFNKEIIELIERLESELKPKLNYSKFRREWVWHEYTN